MDVGRALPLERVHQRLSILRLEIIDLTLWRLHIRFVRRSAVLVHPVDEALLEIILLMGDLVLPFLSVYERLIHAVLIVQGWHLLRCGSIVMAKELVHLTFASFLICLQINLVLVIDLLALLPFLLVRSLLRTNLLVCVAIFKRAERVILVVLAVEDRRLPVDLLLAVLHLRVFVRVGGFCLGQIHPMVAFFLMLQHSLRLDKNVAWMVLANEDGLTTAVLAASDVELVLSEVVRLVVVVEGAHEYHLSHNRFVGLIHLKICLCVRF